MRVLRKLLKALAWIAGSLVALVVAFYLVLLAVNWRDQPPSEAALRFAAAYRDRPAVADAENGFVYVSGFFVEPGEDPQAAGIQRIDWLRREMARPSHGYVVPPEREYDYKAARSTAVQAISDACREQNADCLIAVEQGNAAIEEWSSAERWLLERYQTLISRPAWLETAPADPGMSLPPYATVIEGQKLLFVEASRRAGEKDAAAVRKLLSQDVRFWRHMFEASDLLITKMIAVAGVKRHFRFANRVLRRLPPELEAAARPPEWEQEITLAERSMSRTWIGEWTYASRVLELRDVDEFWNEDDEEVSFARRTFQRATAPLFQKQDLTNQMAEMFEQASIALDVPYPQYREGLARAQGIFRGGESELPVFRLYNPLGAIYRWISSSTYETYSVRATDIEGVRRAALLTSELRSRGLAAAQVVTELPTSPIRNPYTDEPFGWDAKKGALTFTGLERLPRGLHEFVF